MIMTFNIVETDNYAGDYPDESFLLTHSVSEEVAKEIANIMNNKYCGNNAPRFWKVVPKDYVLEPGFEP